MPVFIRISAALCVLGLVMTACTVNHTEAELRAGEPGRNTTDRSEEARDEEIGEEGGIGLEEIDAQDEEAVRESDL